jgi:hypothetical protein
MRYLVLAMSILFPFHLFVEHGSIGKEAVILRLKNIYETVQSVTSSNEEVINERNDLRMLINDIIIRVDQFKGEFPSQYVLSLDRLGSAARKLPDTTAAVQIEILRGISRDLSIKFKDRSNTLSSRLFNDLISVTVVSERRGTAVSHLRVRYAALGYSQDPNNPDGSFQTLTSPAKEQMVPGYYLIWLTEDGSFAMLRNWKGEISPDKTNTIQFDLP